MKAPQLLCGVVALAAALTGCQRPETRADVNKTVSEVASDVKVETQKAAAKAGDRLADGWLTTKIQSKFVGDRDIHATDISVSSHDGVVTLKGRVQNEPMRALAVAIAKNTDGVTQVVDQLSVTVAGPVPPPPVSTSAPAGAVPTTGTAVPDGTVRPDDARITSGIQAKYYLDDNIRGGRRIDVDSSNGIVTLRGEVGSEEERANALLLARNTEGVQRVEDHLTVIVEQQNAATTPPASSAGSNATAEQAAAAPKVDDAAMTTLMQTKLSSDRQLKGTGIEVTAKNGVVLLEGTVPSTAARQRALTIARGTDGVTQVVDRMRVGKRTK